MLVRIIALLISFIPTLCIYFWFKSFKTDQKYKDDCRKVLLKGVLSSLAVVGFSLVASLLWALTGLGKTHPVIDDAFKDFILAAASEEICKGYFAAKYIKENRTTISWIDMIVFTSIVGMGFCFIESFVYMFQTNIGQILVRGVTAMHPVLGMIMGYYNGKAVAKNKKGYHVLAFLIPWLIHGIYDWCLSDSVVQWCEYLIVGPFVALLVDLIYLIVIIVFIVKSRKNNVNVQPLQQSAAGE